MNRWIFRSFWYTGVLLMCMGCASTVPLVNQTPHFEADAWRQACVNVHVDSLDLAHADSLLALSRSVAARGKLSEGNLLDQLAIYSYKLALSNKQLRTTEKRVQELEKEHAVIKQKLKNYKEVLNELEKMRGQ